MIHGFRHNFGSADVASLSGSSATLIEITGCESNFVVPIDREGIQTERLEIVKVLQFPTNALLHQRCEIDQASLFQKSNYIYLPVSNSFLRSS